MDKKEKEIMGAIAKALRAVGEALVVVACALTEEVSEAPAAAQTQSDEKPRRGRKPKSAQPPVEEEEETDVISVDDLKNEPSEEDEDFADLEEEEEEKAVDEKTLRSKLVEYAKAKSKDAAIAVLKKFKAEKVNDLKPSEYGKVYAELEKGLK